MPSAIHARRRELAPEGRIRLSHAFSAVCCRSLFFGNVCPGIAPQRAVQRSAAISRRIGCDG